jgi:hypothetical protein
MVTLPFDIFLILNPTVGIISSLYCPDCKRASVSTINMSIINNYHIEMTSKTKPQHFSIFIPQSRSQKSFFQSTEARLVSVPSLLSKRGCESSPKCVEKTTSFCQIFARNQVFVQTEIYIESHVIFDPSEPAI